MENDDGTFPRVHGSRTLSDVEYIALLEKVAEATRTVAGATEAAARASHALTNLLAGFMPQGAQPVIVRPQADLLDYTRETYSATEVVGELDVAFPERAEPDSIAEFFDFLKFLRKTLRDLKIYKPSPEPNLREFVLVRLQQAFLAVGSETDDKEAVLGNQISLERASQPVLIPPGSNFPDGSFDDPNRTLGEFLGLVVSRTLDDRIARQFRASASEKDSSLDFLADAAILDLNIEELYATDADVKAELIARLNQFPAEFGVTPEKLKLFLSSPYTTVREVIDALTH